MPFFGLGGLFTGLQARFSGTAVQTVANTTNETTLLPTGVGQKVIPAGYFQAGNTVRLIVRGIYSGAVVPTTALFKVKLNGNVVASGTASALLSGAANTGFAFSETITCMTAGPTGTAAVAGQMQYANGAATRAVVDLNALTPITLDTTVAQALDVTVTWGALSASNSMTTLTATLELLSQ